MRRRELLGGLGTAVGAAIAGCASGTSGDPTADPGGETGGSETSTATDRQSGTTPTATPVDRSITVERRVGPGGFNRPYTLRIEDDGSVRWVVECGRGSEEVLTGDLTPTEHRKLERAVLAADLGSLADEYGPDPDPDDGTDVAATDASPVTLTVTVDGRETSVTYVTHRTTPERLNRLASEIDRIERRLGDPDCPRSTGTPTPEVSATLRIEGGLTPTPWYEEVTATGDGTLRFAHLCSTSDREITDRGSLSGDERTRFRERVLALDVDALADEYACAPGECPTDVPTATLTIRVGDRTKTVEFDSPDPESVPRELRALRKQLAAYADRFAVDCGDGGGSTTAPNGSEP